jgi:glyoxylase-like metal-dependent hydrolase (beta-lactamase superfamily II)
VVTLVRAPNPSAMTLTGTNSYIIDGGNGDGLVIDPGPPVESHVAGLIDAARSQHLRIAAIAITHDHPDHSAAAVQLAQITQAPLYAHPSSRIPRSANLSLEGQLRVGNAALRVIDAPGHTFDHVIFYLPHERALFTGDVILGEGTSVIAPPSGAMRPYQRTLQRLADEFGDARVIYGGHGPAVKDARAKIAEYIDHRRMRERQVLDALREEPAIVPELVRRIYGPERSVLWPAMARQILAHLIALEEEGRVTARPLGRAMTPDEMAMLNPRIEELAGPAEAAVIVAELGTELRLEELLQYRLTEG